MLSMPMYTASLSGAGSLLQQHCPNSSPSLSNMAHTMKHTSLSSQLESVSKTELAVKAESIAFPVHRVVSYARHTSIPHRSPAPAARISAENIRKP